MRWMTLPRAVLFAWIILAVSAVGFLLNLPVLHRFMRMDFAAYYYAATLVSAGHQDALYDPTDVALARSLGIPRSHGPARYIYPPVLAVCMAPLSRLPYSQASSLWFFVSLAGIAVAMAVVRHALHVQGWRGQLLTPLVGIVVLNMAAVQSDLAVGNLNWFILLAMAWSLCLGLQQRTAAAGAVLALPFAVKIVPAVFLTPYMLNRKWRVLPGFAVASVLILGLAAALAGYRPLLQFLTVFDGRLDETAVHHNNQSLYGFVYRFVRGSRLHMAIVDMPQVAGRVSQCLSLLVFGAGFALAWLRRKDLFYCYSILAVTVTLASPMTWRQHLVTLILPLAYLTGRYFHREALGQTMSRLWLVLPVAFALVFLLMVQISGATPPSRSVMGTLSISREFFGQVALWLTLAGIGLGDRPAGTSRTSPTVTGLVI